MPRKVRPHPKPNRSPTFIRAWRKHRNITLESLVSRLFMQEHMEISDGQLSRIERGESPYSQDLIEALARVLNCTKSQLIERAPTALDNETPMTTEEQRQVAAFLRAIRTTRTGTNG